LAIESIKIKTNRARDQITLGIAKEMKGDYCTSNGKAFASLDSTTSRDSRVLQQQKTTDQSMNDLGNTDTSNTNVGLVDLENII